MHTILEMKQLSNDVYMMKIEAPLIAKARKPGQFIILQVDEQWGERIPLTIADASEENGTIDIVFQAVGKTTLLLAEKKVGESIPAVLGPLGMPSEIENFGRVVCVGGGIGVAPLYPIVEGMKKAGNHVTVIIGARNKDLLIMEDEMRAIADEVIVTTDDGSAGRKDLVTVPLKELCESDTPPNHIVAIGPTIMMKFCVATTKPYGIKTIVSLNTIMIDGTGMCGGCRVSVGGETKFVCVDGPEFDGHLVDFDNMMKRLKTFKPEEDVAREAHKCRLQAQADKLASQQ